jgi:hypothetical protein
MGRNSTFDIAHDKAAGAAYRQEFDVEEQRRKLVRVAPPAVHGAGIPWLDATNVNTEIETELGGKFVRVLLGCWDEQHIKECFY